VRVYDQIMMDLSQRLAFVRSQPLTDDLMRRVAGIVDTRLEYLKSQGWITGFRPTVADRRNNPPEDLDRGILNVQIDLDPAIPADHIILNFLRQRTRTLSLQTQV
jgi:phage tail sheath protein FI